MERRLISDAARYPFQIGLAAKGPPELLKVSPGAGKTVGVEVGDVPLVQVPVAAEPQGALPASVRSSAC
jgi:hypothetical protein